MSIPVLFLLGAVALSALGGMGVWIASRPRPEKFGSSIETFNRDLDALAPPGSRKNSRRQARSHPVAGTNSTSRTHSARQGSSTHQQSSSASARPKPGPRPQPRS